MNRISRQVILYEAAGFAAVIAVLWLDELLDAPSRLLGGPRTPVNWQEAALETALVLALGLAVIRLTNSFLRRVKHLEGFLPICSHCRRIRAGDQWVSLETHLHDHSDARLSHGLCPDCLREHYPEFPSH